MRNKLFDKGLDMEVVGCHVHVEVKAFVTVLLVQSPTIICASEGGLSCWSTTTDPLAFRTVLPQDTTDEELPPTTADALVSKTDELAFSVTMMFLLTTNNEPLPRLNTPATRKKEPFRGLPPLTMTTLLRSVKVPFTGILTVVDWMWESGWGSDSSLFPCKIT